MKVFDADKTRMIGLPYGEKNYDDMLSRFHLIPERYGRTDRPTDGQTDRFAISISRVSVLTRDKNYHYSVLRLSGMFVFKDCFVCEGATSSPMLSIQMHCKAMSVRAQTFRKPSLP